MPTTKPLSVSQLKLDLGNFRTMPQSSEIDAIHALIWIKPVWFWALTESLLADGYHPTENIIVLEDASTRPNYVVKEGNRRIAALKLALGLVSRSRFSVPAEIESKILALSSGWKTENQVVPCAIYKITEAAVVDRIVARTHGKAEQAGRDDWNAVATARHNRDQNHASEPALDFLEAYLKHGRNITAEQKERWGGVYPLTVLEDAIKRLAPRFGLTSSRELVDRYPTHLASKSALEDILRDIGDGTLDFFKLRDRSQDFGQHYGVPPVVSITPPPAAAASPSGTSTPSGNASMGGALPMPGTRRLKAVPVNDPRAVRRKLKRFFPRGNNREKLVTLLEEARGLKLKKHPHSFCFLLRSMFEISAKCYCDDHKKSGLSVTKTDGNQKTLEAVLREITNHLTNNKKNIPMTKTLHGAMAELAKKDGFLSVTSMNQLIHNPRFSIDETHISTLFFNIFPLLEEMNR